MGAVIETRTLPPAGGQMMVMASTGYGHAVDTWVLNEQQNDWRPQLTTTPALLLTPHQLPGCALAGLGVICAALTSWRCWCLRRSLEARITTLLRPARSPATAFRWQPGRSGALAFVDSAATVHPDAPDL